VYQPSACSQNHEQLRVHAPLTFVKGHTSRSRSSTGGADPDEQLLRRITEIPANDRLLHDASASIVLYPTSHGDDDGGILASEARTHNKGSKSESRDYGSINVRPIAHTVSRARSISALSASKGRPQIDAVPICRACYRQRRRIHNTIGFALSLLIHN
jgi:hypothetical protein